MSEWIWTDGDGDGVGDSYATDTDGNGTLDRVGWDANGNGYVEITAEHLPNGGVVVAFDTNENGVFEVRANDYNADTRPDEIMRDPNEDGVFSTADSVYPNGADLSQLPVSQLLSIGSPGVVGADPLGIVHETNQQLIDMWLDATGDVDHDGIPDGPDLDD